MTFKRRTPTDLADPSSSSKGGWTANQIDARDRALRKRNVLGLAGLPTAMTTPPTVTDNTSSGLAGIIAYPDRGGVFRYTRRMAYHPSFPNSGYYWPMAAASTNNTDGARVTPPFTVSFVTDAPTFEVLCKGASNTLRFRINGQLVTAGGGGTVTTNSDGATHYISVALGSRAMRRVDVDFSANGAFGGVRTAATDTLQALPANEQPRLMVIGDSFTEPTGATGAHTGFATTLAQMLGCVPIPTGWGATGYIDSAGGTKTTFRGRFATDVVPEAPDIIVFAGGINDYPDDTAAVIGAEALLLFQQSLAAFPLAQQYVVSPFWRNGVSTFPTNLLATRDAIKASALSVGFTFLDVLELPKTVTFSTTLSAAITAGAATTTTPARMSSSAANGAGFTFEVGTGTANAERIVATSWTGGGPFTLTPTTTFTKNHSSGEAVNLVGGCLWTGTGKVGGTTGNGNSDFLVSNDGIHPSPEGHDAIAYALYEQIVASLAA
jgi:lysophospholipase L1-like esterase